MFLWDRGKEGGIMSKLKETRDVEETLTIPAGHFVMSIDLDCEEPYVEIASDPWGDGKEKIVIPGALAYCLKNHSGSKEREKMLIELGKWEKQQEIKGALGIKDV